MKKYFFFALTAAMMSFAGCQKNEIEGSTVANGEGSTFELVADISQTKTTLDGLNVEWEEGDVIYVVTEDEEWGAAYEDKDNTNLNTIAEFVYGDAKFTTEASISAGDHVFNAMYTRADQKTWHRGAGSSHSLSVTQSQDCTNPTAHIKENDALVGTFTATTPVTEVAQVTMSHIYTMMQINVRNSTGAPVDVTKFEMTAEGADLAGIFNVTSFETPSITAKEGEAATETITVNVTGGEVDAGDALPVYFVMAPLSDYTGDVTFKVTAADGKTYTKTTAVSNLDFNAGAYNTTPYTISEADVVEPEPEQPEGLKTVTISFANTSQRTSHSDDKQVWENDGVVFTNSKGSSTSNVGDYSNPARFYKSSDITVTAPGNITNIEFDCEGIGGNYTSALKDIVAPDGTSSTVTYKTLSAQLRANSITVTYVVADPTAPSITAGNVTGVSARGVESAVLTYEIDNLEYSDLIVTCDRTVVTSASMSEDGVINYVVSANATTSARDGSISISNSNGTVTRNVIVSQLAPVFTVSRPAVELGATADSQTTVTVTSDFDWTLSFEGTGYTVTPDSYTWDEDAKETVTIKAKANRTEEGVAELGTITLVNSTTGQKLTIKVTQATSFVAQGAVTVEMDIFANKGTLSGKSISWTKDGFKVTNNQARSSNAIRTSDSDHFRLYANSELIFTSSSKKFNKVVVTCTSPSYASALETSAKKAELTATVSGSLVTISTSSPTTVMPTIKMSAQSRIKKVVVELK